MTALAVPGASDLTVGVDIERVLYLADEMKRAGEDPWELLTMAAHTTEGDADVLRWFQCDVAAKVDTIYGEGSMDKFAVDAHMPVGRAREYKTMGTYYHDRSARAEYLAANKDVITYSHLRTAARFYKDNPAGAYRACDHAVKKTWSVGKLEYVLNRAKRIYGGGKARPRKLLDTVCRWADLPYEQRLTIGLLAYPSDKLVRVTVSEAA